MTILWGSALLPPLPMARWLPQKLCCYTHFGIGWTPPTPPGFLCHREITAGNQPRPKRSMAWRAIALWLLASPVPREEEMLCHGVYFPASVGRMPWSCFSPFSTDLTLCLPATRGEASLWSGVVGGRIATSPLHCLMELAVENVTLDFYSQTDKAGLIIKTGKEA